MALSLKPMDETPVVSKAPPLTVKELKTYYAHFCRDAEPLRLEFTAGDQTHPLAQHGVDLHDSDPGKDVARKQPLTADQYEHLLFDQVRILGSAGLPTSLEQLGNHGRYLCTTFDRLSPKSQQQLIAKSDAVINELAASRNGYVGMVANQNLLPVTDLKKFFADLGVGCKKQEFFYYPDNSTTSPTTNHRNESDPGYIAFNSDPQQPRPLKSMAACDYEEALCAEMFALGAASMPTTPDELRNLGKDVCRNFAQSHRLTTESTQQLRDTWGSVVTRLEFSRSRVPG